MLFSVNILLLGLSSKMILQSMSNHLTLPFLTNKEVMIIKTINKNKIG